jgi:DNA primase
MDLSELLESVDIVDYISQFVELEERGGEYWGISPFTSPPEKTPSFSVRRESGSFYDFSSGIAGNLYTFIRFYFKCSRREAFEKLKEYAGYDGQIMVRTEKMSATKVCQKYSKPKQHQKEVKSKPLPEDIMDRYENRPDKLQIWRDEGISDEVMSRFQVKYDPFSDRIVYPVRNPDGKIVNIGGRALDPEWKEKGQRKYCYFYKFGRIQTLYGLAENMDSILEKHEVILFEGCKSVLKAASWGIQNCAAVLTSHLSADQMKVLAKLGCDVVFALDKEVDVRQDHNIERLKSYVNVFYLKDKDDLLDEKDAPVDKGQEVFQKLYEKKLRFR